MNEDLILDSSTENEIPNKLRLGFRYVEIALAAGIIIGTIIRDLIGYALVDQPILISSVLLALIYLFGNWWLIRPMVRNFRTVTISIIYGIASSSICFALLFFLLFLTGAIQMLIFSFILIVVAFIIDFLSSIKKIKVMNLWLAIRFGLLLTLAIFLSSIADNKRIHFTYRQYPDFLKYYESNMDRDFYDIKTEYFNGLKY